MTITSPQELIAQILEVLDFNEQKAFLKKHLGSFNPGEQDIISEALKEKVLEFMWGDTQRALQIARLLLELAKMTRSEPQYALGLRAKAQAIMVGQGDYQEALRLFDEAVSIHSRLGDPLGEALVQMTRIWALANLGQYVEAIQKGELAAEVLDHNQRLRDLGSLYNNLGLVHNRVGRYDRAFEMFSKAGKVFGNLGAEGEGFLPNNKGNQAWALCNMGRFRESIEASENALSMADELNQITVKARIQHNLGITYLLQGHYTKALTLFDEARDIHLANGQLHEAALCELSSMDCLLVLRRFRQVLEKYGEVRDYFGKSGLRHEEALAALLKAHALSDLGRFEAAIEALEEAKNLYKQEGNLPQVEECDLGIAILLQRKGEVAKSYHLAEKCLQSFRRLDQPFYAAQAGLVLAQNLLELGEHAQCLAVLKHVLKDSSENEYAWMVYKSYDLLGSLAKREGDIEAAYDYLNQSINTLERLRGNLMLEDRAGFLEDKQSVYENMVDLCLDAKRLKMGLDFAERAKSRALLELLAYRFDLRMDPREKKDQPLINEINQLRSKREQRLRYAARAVSGDSLEEKDHVLLVQKEIHGLERQITNLWHRLLVRNANYARDSHLWEVRTESALPYLDQETLLLEYFVVAGQVIVFTVAKGHDSPGEVQAFRLPVAIRHVERSMQQFQMNMKMASRSSLNGLRELEINAQGVLAGLYKSLISPVEEIVAGYSRLIVVPHGALHYLPFHALFDGENYLIQKRQISYLPSSSLLRYCVELETESQGCLAIGHSFGGNLPNAIDEAGLVAEIWSSQPLNEDQATLKALRSRAGTSRLIHLACHGDFRPENPLFSGLALEDGWLTTLDVFNLRLNASLVILSACNTGRNVVGGGDELLGLMRGFLSAGTASLILSLWPVSDRSTFKLMQNFYRALQQGRTKSRALQAAQCWFLSEAGPQEDRYRHPYFWAPFFLVGDHGAL